MPVLHKLAGAVVVVALVLGFVLPGDRNPPEAATAARAAATPPPAAPASVAPSPEPSGPAAPPATPTPTTPPDAPLPEAAPAARAARANELGVVPVLMYHRIVAKPEQSLDRSVGELRAELTALARDGYVPVTAAEFVRGDLDVPAGRHPVVLTFDDGTPGHFALDANGAPAPDTAVAVLREVARAHPGFRPVATFYVNEDMFGLGDRAAEGLAWLVRNGFEIGNHTRTHADLSALTKKRVRAEIGDLERRIVELTGAHTATLAYPFGAVPRTPSWARRDGDRYGFQGVFLAGWRPSESPFAAAFDRYAINRVRSEGKIKENDCRRYCSVAWLEHLRKNPGERYTSDGDPATITFPRAASDRLASHLRDRGRVY
ncbi:polysaccharide deacetylase family protein [Actinomadura flavalba]|uniref:polysaccharide deacetylase family protein n=1 Tax=Actinomadura flavalba TaxID=1120938 RepID=UPI0003626588|nr:polysaccharide deacetylase family protein [Actinomadura flavalba]